VLVHQFSHGGFSDPQCSAHIGSVSFPASPDTYSLATLVAWKGVCMPAPDPLEFRRRAVELPRQKTAPVAQVARTWE
jgi:hypothetical protein